MNVASARLNRDGNVENTTKLDCRRAIREKEFSVDDIERKCLADPAQERRHRAGNRCRIKATAGPRYVREAWAMNGYVIPAFDLRKARQRFIVRVITAQRRDADWGNDLQFNSRMGREPARLDLDKRPEIGPHCIGEKRR